MTTSREIPPWTPTSIAGAEEVWAAGGKVIVVDLVTGDDGEEFHTTDIITKILQSKP